MSSTTIPTGAQAPTSPARPAALLALIGAVVALAGSGVYLSAGLVSAAGAPAPSTGPFGLTEPGPASFGAVAIEHAEKVIGVTNRDLAGRTHGVADIVTADKVRVQASATLTNTGREVAPYSPAQFSLVATEGRRPVASDKRLKAAGASIRAGTLQPDASIDARLSYVVPRDRSQLWVEFRDRGRAKPLLFDLGRASTTRIPGGSKGFQGKDFAPGASAAGAAANDGHDGH